MTLCVLRRCDTDPPQAEPRCRVKPMPPGQSDGGKNKALSVKRGGGCEIPAVRRANLRRRRKNQPTAEDNMETVVVATTFRILEDLEVWHFGNFQVKKRRK